MAKPSSWPWKLADNESRSYKVVSKDGAVIAYMHYPKSVEEGVNLKLVERAPELLEKFKRQQIIMEALIRKAGRTPEDDAFIKAANEMIAEIEIRTAPKGPPG